MGYQGFSVCPVGHVTRSASIGAPASCRHLPASQFAGRMPALRHHSMPN